MALLRVKVCVLIVVIYKHADSMWASVEVEFLGLSGPQRLVRPIKPDMNKLSEEQKE